VTESWFLDFLLRLVHEFSRVRKTKLSNSLFTPLCLGKRLTITVLALESIKSKTSQPIEKNIISLLISQEKKATKADAHTPITI
jgi:hypothetical protein